MALLRVLRHGLLNCDGASVDAAAHGAGAAAAAVYRSQRPVCATRHGQFLSDLVGI